MTESEAKDWVRQRTGSDSDSDATLTDEEIEKLLEESRRPDSSGRLPGDPLWVPTWDLNRAASEGWRIKAARMATTRTASSLDGDRGSDDFRYLNATRMADYYESRRPAPWLA